MDALPTALWRTRKETRAARAMGNIQACCASAGGDAPTPRPPTPAEQQEAEEPAAAGASDDNKLASLMADGVAQVEADDPQQSSASPASAADSAKAEQAARLEQLSKADTAGLETVPLLETEPEPEPEKKAGAFDGAKQMYLNAQKAKAEKAKAAAAAAANAPDPAKWTFSTKLYAGCSIAPPASSSGRRRSEPQLSEPPHFAGVRRETRSAVVERETGVRGRGANSTHLLPASASTGSRFSALTRSTVRCGGTEQSIPPDANASRPLLLRGHRILHQPLLIRLARPLLLEALRDQGLLLAPVLVVPAGRLLLCLAPGIVFVQGLVEGLRAPRLEVSRRRPV